MINTLINKINILGTNLKVLTIGNVTNKLNLLLSKCFQTHENIQINENTQELLNNTLYEHFNIILFIPDSQDIFSQIPGNAIVILDRSLYLEYLEYINSVFAIVIDPIDEINLLNKIYGALSILETNDLIKTKEQLINKYKNDPQSHNIEEFLDKNSGSILFINDDINESISRLQELELSKELLRNISLNLNKLANIFTPCKNLSNIASLFNQFGQFLESIKLASIEPSRYEAFDYLTNILEDLSIFIDELFVYKIIQDTKVFEDSMENNVSYFEAKLYGYDEPNEEDTSLEFFE